MALQHHIFLLLIIITSLLLTPSMVQISEAGSPDPCGRTDFKALCRAISKGERSTSGATTRAIRASIMQANRGKAMAARLSRSSSSKIEKSTASTCKRLYEDIISELSQSVGNLRSRDYSGFNDKLSSVLADVEACNEGYAERGRPSPFSRVNSLLRQHASNCLALSSSLRH